VILLCFDYVTVRVKNKLYVFQNKIATKSKQNKTATKSKQKRNKIMILFDQNFDFVVFLLHFCFDFVVVLF